MARVKNERSCHAQWPRSRSDSSNELCGPVVSFPTLGYIASSWESLRRTSVRFLVGPHSFGLVFLTVRPDVMHDSHIRGSNFPTTSLVVPASRHSGLSETAMVALWARRKRHTRGQRGRQRTLNVSSLGSAEASKLLGFLVRHARGYLRNK